MVKSCTYFLSIGAGCLSGLVLLIQETIIIRALLVVGIFLLCFGWYFLGKLVEAERNHDEFEQEYELAQHQLNLANEDIDRYLEQLYCLDREI